METSHFQYGLMYRPAGIGAVPNVPHQVLPALTDEDGGRYTRHGIFVTERALNSKEVIAFDLSVLADDDLKEELAIFAALDLGDYAEQYLAEAIDTPLDFCHTVADCLKRLRPYRVYVGDLSRFAEMVKSRLEAKVGILEPTAG